MPSLQDSAFIFVLALLLFGPKKLPELARQIGKLMGEFRRASAEFRMQMEDELRVAEQEEQRKKIAAIEAAAPAPPQLDARAPAAAEPLPIATEGELSLMPPDTGLPVARPSGASALAPLLSQIPQTADPEVHQAGPEIHQPGPDAPVSEAQHG